MMILNKKNILISLSTSVIIIFSLEFSIFRSIKSKDFLLNWSYYKERNSWFSLFRTKYHKNFSQAKKQGNTGILVVGTSTASSVFSDDVSNISGKKVFNLSTVLCGGENLLMQLSHAASLPQNNIIIFLSEFSFYQPFSDYPLPDMINIKSFIFLLKIFIENPDFRNHRIFSAAKNAIIYDLLHSLRYAKDFKHAVKNFYLYKLFAIKRTYPSLAIKDPKLTEIKQAKSLNLDNESFKTYYFYTLLQSLKKNMKRVIILRTRFHSAVEKNINKNYSNRFDALLNELSKNINFEIIDLKRDINIDDADFSDYTHFTKDGARKIIKHLELELRSKPL